MSRSEEQLVAEAHGVNGACNVSGLVHSLSRAMTDLWAIAGTLGVGTDWVNTHPVVLLYLEQINFLSGFDPGSLNRAYDYAPPTAATQLAEAAGDKPGLQ